MQKLSLLIAVGAISLPALATADASRYSALMSSRGGQDTLRDLALWEDQRVTGDDKLFSYLKSSNALVRVRAVEVIGRIQDPVDIPRLLPMLRDPDRRVVDETIFALGQMGASDATEALITLCEGAPADRVNLVTEALGKIGGEAAVAFLVESLRDFHSTVRQGAALGLARAEDPAGVNALLIALHDPAVEVTWRVVYALEKVESDRVGEQVVKLYENPDALVRAYVARTMGKQQYGNGVKPLVKMTADKDPRVATNACRALGEIGDKQATRTLGTRLSSHPSHHVRQAAAVALGAIGDKGGKDSLIRALLDRSVGVRVASVQALAAVMGEDAEMFCLQALEDGKRYVRAAALESLGEAGAKEQIDMLMRTAEKDKDPMMRTAAVTALGKFDEDHVRSFLISRLAEEDWVVAATVVSAIGEQRDLAAIPSLVDIYRTRTTRQDGNIRMEIMRVFEQLKPTTGLTIVNSALEDPDKRVRDLAARILREMDLVVPDRPSDRAFFERSFDASRRRMLGPPSGIRHAIISTTHGDIEIELFGDDAIQTVNSFAHLANSDFYSGLSFHRVVPNFVVQGGCPRGDGWGDAGYYIRSEFTRHRYDTGYIGIAHDGKDSGGSQFFMTLSPQRHLDGRYTIFGRVTKGMGIAGEIDQGDTFTVNILD